MGVIASKFWRVCVWIEGGEGVGLMAEMKVLEGELQQDAAGRFAQYLEAEAEGSFAASWRRGGC